LVVYFRRNEYSHKGLIITGAVALAILGFIQSGIIAGVVKLAGGYELFFTNTLSTGFNVGATFFAVLLVALVIMSIMYAHRPSATLRYGILAVLVLMFIPLIGSAFLSAGTKVLITILGGGLAYLIFRIDERCDEKNDPTQEGVPALVVLHIWHLVAGPKVVKSGAELSRCSQAFTLLNSSSLMQALIKVFRRNMERQLLRQNEKVLILRPL
jgi:predicted small integral membrane protein